jgi:hypothetical protein
VLTLSDGPTYDFGTWATGATADHVFILSNSSNVSATGIGAPGSIGASFTYSGGTFPGLGGSCTATLAGGSSCALVVTFSPASATSFMGTITVAYNDGVQAQSATRAVSGVGTTLAALAITDWPPLYYASYGLAPDASVFDFGQVGIGAAADHQFFVTNNGAAVASITDGSTLSPPFAYRGGTFPGAGGTCGGALAPGGSCTVVVTYTGTPGTTTSSFTVNYTGGTSASVMRSLSGTGASTAALQIYDFATDTGGVDLGPIWDFGTVGIGGTSEHTFFIFNSGGAAATGLGTGPASSPFVFPGGFPGGTPGAQPPDGSKNIPYCGTMLAAGAACAITVQFAPAAAGPASGAVSISYNSTLGASRSVKGVGTALAFLSITEDNRQGIVFDYGTRPVSSTTPQVFLVMNGGGQAATNLTAMALPTGFAFSGTGFPGGSGTYFDRSGTPYPYCAAGSLAVGATCAISVDFKPTSSMTFSGEIGFAYGDGSGATATATRAIQGTGTTQAIVSMTSCLNCGGGGDKGNTTDLGAVAVNSTRTVFAFLTNSGAASAVLSDGGVTGAAFTYPNGTYPGGTGSINYNGNNYPFCGPAPFTLIAGATCVVQVLYTAPATAGVQSGTLTVTTGGATTASVSMLITASSTTLAVVSISTCVDCGSGGGGGGTPTQDFGFIAVGSTSNVYFVVSNSGASAATLSADTFTGGPAFYYNGGSYPGGTAGSAVQVNGKTFNFCPASGGSLPPGGRCILQVDYSASGTSTQTGNFSLAVGNATTSSLAYNLSGTPTSLAIVSISDCDQCGGGGGGQGLPTHDFGQVASGSVHHAFFFIRNKGLGAATLTNSGITGSAFSYTTGTYPGGTAGSQVMVNGKQWNFCPTSGGSLPGGASCVVSVDFSATGSAPQMGTLAIAVGGATTGTLGYNLTGTPTTLAIVSLTDNPNGGGCCGNPPTHDFGTVAASSVNNTFFFVRNAGSAAATLTDGGITGTGFGYTGGSYPGGTAGGSVNVWGMNYAYCPTSGGQLAAGATCVLGVTYTASSGNATQGGTITLTLTGATAPSLTYNLAGHSSTAAIVYVSPCFGCGGNSNFDFGTAGTPLDAVLVVQNVGAASAGLTDGATLNAPFSYSSGTYPGGTGTVKVFGQTLNFCSSSLAAGTNCAVSIRYSAASSGNSVLTINLTGAASPNVTEGVTGTTTTRALVTVSEGDGFFGCTDNTCGGPYDFGTLTNPTYSSRDFIVSNRGALATVALGVGSALSTPFSYGPMGAGTYPGGTGTRMVNGVSYSYCSAVLAPGAQCVLTVNFSPPAGAGAYGSAINLAYSDSMGSVTPNANRNLTGKSN